MKRLVVTLKNPAYSKSTRIPLASLEAAEAPCIVEGPGFVVILALEEVAKIDASVWSKMAEATTNG